MRGGQQVVEPAAKREQSGSQDGGAELPDGTPREPSTAGDSAPIDSGSSTDDTAANGGKAGSSPGIGCEPIRAAIQAGGSGEDMGMSLAMSSDGSIYTTGYFSGEATFDDATITSTGKEDAFVAKYRPDGSLAWLRQLGGEQSDVGYSIAVTDDGAAYVAGVLDKTVSPDMLASTASGQVIFLAKYTADGELVWMHEASGDAAAGPAQPWGIAAAADGSVYMTGEFRGMWSFGDQPLVSGGDADIFLVEYAADGTLLWLRRAGGTGYDAGRAVAVFSGDGSVYVTGEHAGDSMFESTHLTVLGGHRLFVARYSANGNCCGCVRLVGQ